jgi:hypothetical protein
LESIQLFFKISSRQKRDTSSNGTLRVLKLYVEYLIVIDSTTYNVFSALYTNLSSSLLAEYMNIFFVQLVNGEGVIIN